MSVGDIAIVGIALHVPGASSLDQYWENLRRGRDCLRRSDEWHLARLGEPWSLLRHERFRPVAAAVLDPDVFDAEFFGMSPLEAERVVPSQRWFLQCAWSALEDAAIDPYRDARTVAVFAGADLAVGDLQVTATRDPYEAMPVSIGGLPDYLTSRVSYKLGFHGPAVTVLAACATSLVAAHFACRSLREGESDLAVIGGASLSEQSQTGYLVGPEGMLSASGVVRPFDARADGTVFGHGVGAMVLQRLEDARARGNPIYAVIKGSAISNDGNPPGKNSFIAPASSGQTAAVRAALDDAGVGADAIGYVEAHGTATRIGDPIEAKSLIDVYRQETDASGYCGLGSVKANVGHLGAAAGIASLIKTCLVLKNGTLPPMANFTSANPQIDFEGSPFYVPTQAGGFRGASKSRYAAVSSFGFGGSNAHVILEAYRTSMTTASTARRHLLPLSARDEPALHRRGEDLRGYLRAHAELPLADVAHTLQRGRAPMAVRTVWYDDGSGPGPRDLFTGDSPVRCPEEPRPLVFLFPGQGSQRNGMGLALYHDDDGYRASIDRCCELLKSELELDLRDIIHAAPGEDDGQIIRTAIAQPALFVVEYALAQYYLDRGLRPAALLGHSVGELVAACIAGVYSLSDGLRLVAARGRLMQSCEPGMMAAVFLPPDELEPLLPERVELAAVNAPALSVVSGPTTDVEALLDDFDDRGIGSRRLRTSHAFHSWMMEPALDAFRAVLGDIELCAPRLPVISNLTGAPLTPAQAADPEYWTLQIRRPVAFSAGVSHLLGSLIEDDPPVFLEVGPGNVLSDLVRRHRADAVTEPSMGIPEAGVDESGRVFTAIARLWRHGVDVDWTRWYPGEPRQRLSLPGYPFQGRRLASERNERLDNVEPLKLYDSGWKAQACDPQDPEREPFVWLLFAEAGSLADRLSEVIGAGGEDVLRVSVGDSFVANDDGFRVHPTCAEDVGRVIDAALERASGRPVRIVNLWQVTGVEDPARGNTAEDFAHANRLGFYHLLALARAAMERGIIRDLDVLVVVDGLVALSGETHELRADKAGVLGPCRALPVETRLRIRCVDVAPVELSSAECVALCERIVDEACHGQSPRLLVALRPGGRWIEEMYPLINLPRSRMRLRDSGTVLVTGGTGGLGIEVARMLFETSGARVLLGARWTLPPESHWVERARTPDRVGRALAAILDLRRRGADIEIVTMDMTSRESIFAALKDIRARHGGIHGVIHAAGVIDDGPALDKSPEIAEKVFAAKAIGAFYLEEALADDQLDLLVYFSSQASYFPGPGRVDYTAANSVLDTLARRRRGTGLTTSIGWGAWIDIGMALETATSLPTRASAPRMSEDSPGTWQTLDHPLLDRKRVAGDGTRIYRGSAVPGRDWVVDEHAIEGRPLLSGTTIIHLVHFAFSEHLGADEPVKLGRVGLLRPLFVDGNGVELELVFMQGGAEDTFEVRARPLASESEWVRHAVGFASRCDTPAYLSQRMPTQAGEERPAGESTSSVNTGGRWNCWYMVRGEGDGAIYRMRLPDGYHDDAQHFGVHPAIMDVCFAAAVTACVPDPLPYTYDEIRIYRSLPPEVLVQGLSRESGQGLCFDITVTDVSGQTLMEVEGFVVKDMAAAGIAAVNSVPDIVQLDIGELGSLDSMTWQALDLAAPGSDEIQIDVVASGLNFRDVLLALGQLPSAEDAIYIGSECSGFVRAVGPGVTRFRVGDPVMATALNGFATRVNVSVDAAIVKPDNLSFEEAAGIPVTFLTAAWSIEKLAKLQPGERILIHAAAGGVGLAAVQLARCAGAQIFATAGRPEKREYLEGLGIEHVMDSRSLDFAKQVMERTGGEGIDVVLNALAGEYIPASLGVLRRFGRFVEIGKRDILSNAAMDLFPFRNNLTYHAVDLGQIFGGQHSEIGPLFEEIGSRFQRGELQACPTEVFPMEHIDRAFKHLARANHIGKVVVRLRDDPASRHVSHRDFELGYGPGIRTHVGLETLRLLLSCDVTPPFVMATAGELSQMGERGSLQTSLDSRSSSRQQIGADYEAPEGEVEEELVKLWEKTLGVSPIGVNDPFLALGGDSIAAIEVQYAISRLYGKDVPTTALFDEATVRDLANLIVGKK